MVSEAADSRRSIRIERPVPVSRGAEEQGWPPFAMRREIILLASVSLLSAWFSSRSSRPVLLYDDFAYVPENPMVRSGISTEGIRWAFTTFTSDNWFPSPGYPTCGYEWCRPGSHHLVMSIALLNAIAPLRPAGVVPRALCGRAPSSHVRLTFNRVGFAWIARAEDVLSTSFGSWQRSLGCPMRQSGNRTAYAGAFVLARFGL